LAPIAAAPGTRILLESHGRQPIVETIDVSRTVGWFTARYPVVLETTTACDAGRHIKQTKEALRAVPHNGISYEALRYAGGDPRLGAVTPPQVAFNYLGQLDDDLDSEYWRWTREAAGASVDPDAPLLHEIEIIGFVADGRLRLSIGYSAERFAARTIVDFGDRLQLQLAAIIDHAREAGDRTLTPSDIDYDGFDIDTLDRFLDEL
jgi:iturin family lipopeptide synthetase B